MVTDTHPGEKASYTEANASETRLPARVYRVRFDDGVWLVLRAHGVANARMLAYQARAGDQPSPRVVDVEKRAIK